ncbi:hypothetical protein N7448_011297 [Penicillium atrosanguineum]|nr:hypothetical protein N7448_011297 [Penicillium atrosanguineum]
MYADASGKKRRAGAATTIRLDSQNESSLSRMGTERPANVHVAELRIRNGTTKPTEATITATAASARNY